MAFAALFRRKSRPSAAHALYGEIVNASRAPAFFAAWGVPDTLDGRFEMIALHAFLALRRLKSAPGASAFSQELFDLMFADLDRNLREMGASDLGVGRQVKVMAQSFYGRIRAYERGLAGEENLEEALKRNMFGTANPAPAQLANAAAYLRRQDAALARAPATALLRGELPLDAGEGA
jgi:cytochrome b pre-mRNA-processing protein 3